MKSLSFDAIGTKWQIDLTGNVNLEPTLEKSIKDRIERFENTYSRFRDNSLVGQIAKSKGDYFFPEDSKELFEIYRVMYELTDGLMTPLIGGTLVDAGYDKSYSLTTRETILAPKKWNEVMEWNYPKLKTNKPVGLDFGAAGK